MKTHPQIGVLFKRMHMADLYPIYYSDTGILKIWTHHNKKELIYVIETKEEIKSFDIKDGKDVLLGEKMSFENISKFISADRGVNISVIESKATEICDNKALGDMLGESRRKNKRDNLIDKAIDKNSSEKEKIKTTPKKRKIDIKELESDDWE